MSVCDDVRSLQTHLGSIQLIRCVRHRLRLDVTDLREYSRVQAGRSCKRRREVGHFLVPVVTAHVVFAYFTTAEVK